MDYVVNTALVAFLAAFAGYFTLQMVTLFRSTIVVNRNTDLERAILRSRIDQALDVRRLDKEKSSFSWTGYRKFEVTRKLDEGAGIHSFYLKPHDRKPLPPFVPGQYLTFEVHLPDSPKSIVRCYSLSDSPNHRDCYRITNGGKGFRSCGR